MGYRRGCSLVLWGVFCLLVFLGVHSWSGPAMAATEYNISVSSDFSGPYADMFQAVSSGQKIVFSWWNETVGKKLGVQANYKPFDSRYDATVVASMWPGILSGVKPVSHLGVGGPDVAALMQRLPNDKMPMFMATGTYGYIWQPNQWVFQARPTYVHELAGFLKWAQGQLKEKRPIRFAAISTQGIPAYEDGVNGAKKMAEAIKDFQFVGAEWVPLIPVEISSQIKRLVKEKPDFIWLMTNLSQNVATHRALQEVGAKIPLVFASHNGISETTKSLELKEMEGYFDTMAISTQMDTDIEAYKIHETYKKDVAPKNQWSVGTIQGMIQPLLALRAMERAIAKVGADKLTGEAVYAAVYDKEFTEKELLGLLPDLKFTKDSPFSAANMRVKSTTVKSGKEARTFEGWHPIPAIPKW